ncbi:hypothetical protein DFH06DRAFT_1415366 [Mycena polygramma]|nr:hypothetical protein DFH06DRAFT_1415366 [Mycena polygramma]
MKSGPWISQANHILGRLGITSNLDKYMVVHNVTFWVKVSPSDLALEPEGFLFLAPVIDFQTGPSTFTWPQRFPAYWSLDPEGVNILSMDEATQLLWFPSIKLSVQIAGYSWDDRIYAGLRQFHQAKGFEPDSQDVARHLGQPLYQLVNEIDAPFAHGVNGAKDSHSVPTEEEFEEFLQRQSVEAEVVELPSYSEETVPTSGTFRLFINARLALILFLALLKICETVHA